MVNKPLSPNISLLSIRNVIRKRLRQNCGNNSSTVDDYRAALINYFGEIAKNMSFAQQNGQSEGEDHNDFLPASMASPHGEGVLVEPDFARLTAMEVDNLEMHIASILGDPDKHLFYSYIYEETVRLEDQVASLVNLADRTVRNLQNLQNNLSETLEQRLEELDQEFAARQEAQRTGIPQLSVFGACTPGETLASDLLSNADLWFRAEPFRDHLQKSYYKLQLVKKHATYPLPAVFDDLDRQLRENLILIEQMHTRFKEQTKQLRSMYDTWENGNSTMH